MQHICDYYEYNQKNSHGVRGGTTFLINLVNDAMGSLALINVRGVEIGESLE